MVEAMQDYSILVVDDNDALRMVLSEELTDEGFTVSTAEDGEEGLLSFVTIMSISSFLTSIFPELVVSRY